MSGRFLRKLADIFFPRRCMFCGELLCGDLKCSCIGTNVTELAPFERHVKQKLPTLALFADVVCHFRYTGKVATAVAEYKFRGYPDYRIQMAQFMAEDIAQMAENTPFDAVVCVPSWQNKTVHAKLLAKAVGDETGIPFMPLLYKNRKTEKQHELKREKRAKNVQGAFSVTDEALVRGKNILIVDDVLTSGNTISQCAETLLKAGAKSVSACVFSLASS